MKSMNRILLLLLLWRLSSAESIPPNLYLVISAFCMVTELRETWLMLVGFPAG